LFAFGPFCCYSLIVVPTLFPDRCLHVVCVLFGDSDHSHLTDSVFSIPLRSNFFVLRFCILRSDLVVLMESLIVFLRCLHHLSFVRLRSVTAVPIGPAVLPFSRSFYVLVVRSTLISSFFLDFFFWFFFLFVATVFFFFFFSIFLNSRFCSFTFSFCFGVVAFRSVHLPFVPHRLRFFFLIHSFTFSPFLHVRSYAFVRFFYILHIVTSLRSLLFWCVWDLDYNVVRSRCDFALRFCVCVDSSTFSFWSSFTFGLVGSSFCAVSFLSSGSVLSLLCSSTSPSGSMDSLVLVSCTHAPHTHLCALLPFRISFLPASTAFVSLPYALPVIPSTIATCHSSATSPTPLPLVVNTVILPLLPLLRMPAIACSPTQRYLYYHHSCRAYLIIWQWTIFSLSPSTLTLTLNVR